MPHAVTGSAAVDQQGGKVSLGGTGSSDSPMNNAFTGCFTDVN